MTDEEFPYPISSYYELVLNAHGYVRAKDLLLYVSFLQLQGLLVSTVEVLETSPKLGVPNGGVFSFPFEEPITRQDYVVSFNYFQNELGRLLEAGNIQFAEVWLHDNVAPKYDN